MQIIEKRDWEWPILKKKNFYLHGLSSLLFLISFFY